MSIPGINVVSAAEYAAEMGPIGNYADARISFQMVAGGRVFDHPCARGRDCVLEKLIGFHHDHQTPALQVQQDVQQAITQLPPGEHAADPLVPARLEELNRIQEHRRRGPQPLGEILPAVLAALGVNVVQSPQSATSDPA